MQLYFTSLYKKGIQHLLSNTKINLSSQRMGNQAWKGQFKNISKEISILKLSNYTLNMKALFPIYNEALKHLCCQTQNIILLLKFIPCQK